MKFPKEKCNTAWDNFTVQIKLFRSNRLLGFVTRVPFSFDVYDWLSRRVVRK